MSIRNTSGKFRVPTFGRKVSEGPSSPSRANGSHYFEDDGGSPSRDGGAAQTFSKLGNKVGKTIAHQSLLPSFGNKDTRLLQDVISSEKGVLAMTEKVAVETAKAGSALTPYGQQEGPDLQDVLTHSSTLLNQLSTAFHVFMDHQANMRWSYKRVRNREEAFEELRRRRRSTGQKAEQAEKKLAKMGPENKALPQQTELLESLRQDMRQMDSEIIAEEAKLGDFKRQIVKQALSLKFGGLEELGEKMCIIGELGKLVLEEIPLEETPPGYGRAPYHGYDRTENAVNEATKCLATVQFHAGSSAPKAPGLPPHQTTGRLDTPQLPQGERIAAAEEYANYPGNQSSPDIGFKGKARDYSLDTSNPYGGISNPYVQGQEQERAPGGFAGTRGDQNEVVWQGPTDEALHEGSAQASPPNGERDYEYEQQRQMDEERQREEAAWREHQADGTGNGANPQDAPPDSTTTETTQRPWEPLNVRRDRSSTPDPTALTDIPLGNEPGLLAAPLAPALPTTNVDHQYSDSEAGPDTLTPPRRSFDRPSSPDANDFHTPLEGPIPLPDSSATTAFVPSFPIPPSPPPIHTTSLPSGPTISSPTTYSPASVPVGGKISAAAFRRGAKPRTSVDPDDPSQAHGGRRPSLSPDSAARMARRLPVPPVGPISGLPGSNGYPFPASEGDGPDARAGGEMTRLDTDTGSFAEVAEERSPPPTYGSQSIR